MCVASISDLHRKLGCSSGFGLKLFILDSQTDALPVDQIAAVERHICKLCGYQIAVSPRPTVTLPNYRRRGRTLSLYIGSFRFPNAKNQLKALLMIDTFSFLMTGDLFSTEHLVNHGSTIRSVLLRLVQAAHPTDRERGQL